MRPILCAILVAAVSGCSNETEITQQSQARGQPPTLRYEVAKLSSSLGGTVSVPNGIDNHGVLAGYSQFPGNDSMHAALWRGGTIVDLGTLGGRNSAVLWPGQNDRGTVVGVAETADQDPLEEDWSCSAFFPSVTHLVCRGFVWEDGEMTPLPTLGGTHGFATGVNNRRQAVGWAETLVHDPTCNETQVLQFRAVTWEETGDGWVAKELRPLRGDSTSAATAINDRGQVVGISGDCDIAVGQLSARHAVLWEHGKVTDIGNLGGDAWHTPMAINNRGEVVGFSNPAEVPGITFRPLAFRWTRQNGIESLKALPGDTFSQAFGINARGQIVGRSCGGPSGCRAVLWDRGVMSDLNDLVGESPDTLRAARDIDDAGKITGNLSEGSTGNILTFVATPER